MPKLFNANLAKHPFNWVIVFTMVLIWVFAADLAQAYLSGRQPGDPAETTV